MKSEIEMKDNNSGNFKKQKISGENSMKTAQDYFDEMKYYPKGVTFTGRLRTPYQIHHDHSVTYALMTNDGPEIQTVKIPFIMKNYGRLGAEFWRTYQIDVKGKLGVIIIFHGKYYLIEQYPSKIDILFDWLQNSNLRVSNSKEKTTKTINWGVKILQHGESMVDWFKEGSPPIYNQDAFHIMLQWYNNGIWLAHGEHLKNPINKEHYQKIMDVSFKYVSKNITYSTKSDLTKFKKNMDKVNKDFKERFIFTRSAIFYYKGECQCKCCIERFEFNVGYYHKLLDGLYKETELDLQDRLKLKRFNIYNYYGYTPVPQTTYGENGALKSLYDRWMKDGEIIEQQYRLIWQLNMKNLNKEYNDKFTTNDVDPGIVFKKVQLFNYRNLLETKYLLKEIIPFNLNKIHQSYCLPDNYYRSMNDIRRKEIALEMIEKNKNKNLLNKINF
tara:strand:+ start:2161 stop:3489 length:1329 start_codon:yes stop_codon:yes gene_type:complete